MSIPAKDIVVQAIGVEKRYGDHQVLKGIDFVARRGEVTCILGSSGGGKSTFLRCINHLESIDGGELLVDGHLVGIVTYPDLLRAFVQVLETATLERITVEVIAGA